MDGGKKIICPYCHSVAKLTDSVIIYKRSYGNVWICTNYPDCDAYVGTHKFDNRTPLGRLANAELREWKKKAHEAFDPLWRSGKMKRNKAYELMQMLMGLTKEQAHIGELDVIQCKILIEKLKQHETTNRG